MNHSVRLSREGLITLTTGVVMMGTGLVSVIPAILLWGQAILCLLVIGYVHTLARKSLIDGHLEVSCRPPSGPGGGLLANQNFTLHIDILNQTAVSLATRALSIVTNPIIQSQGPGIILPNEVKERQTWAIPMHAVMVGPGFVHGVRLVFTSAANMFEVSYYIPQDLTCKVLPSTAGSRIPTKHLAQTAHRDAVSSQIRPMEGTSGDIREIREWVSGDSFKHIAWKATARNKRVMVKSFESEKSLSVYVLLDISSSVRCGTPGHTQLDHAIALTFDLARKVIREKGRFGLISFDTSVLGYTRVNGGHSVLKQITEHLMEVNAVVHESFTSVSAQDLVEVVAQFIQFQGGPTFSLPDLSLPGITGPGPYDTQALVSYVKEWINQNPERRLSPHMTPPSETLDQAILRTYCRLNGLDLGTRGDVIPPPKEIGLTAAINHVLQKGGGPHTIIAVTDLSTIRDQSSLLGGVRLCRRHRHRFQVMSPSLAKASQREDTLEARLTELYDSDADIKRGVLAGSLNSIGVNVRQFAIGPANERRNLNQH